MEYNSDLIGEPVFGDSKGKRSNFANANWRIDTEGSHVYRILPPFGYLAKAGKWSYYETLHWGYKLTNGKMRPFRCIQRKNPKTKMLEQKCPMCVKIEETKLNRENREKELQAQKKTPDEIKDILKPLDAWLRTYNTQRGHFLNVLRPDGQIGRLFIKIDCMKNLNMLFNNLITKDQINPVSAKQGVWVDFQRVGLNRNDTKYPVEVVTEEVAIQGGRKAKLVKDAQLSDEVLKRMEKEAFDLPTFYTDLNYDQIQALVSSGGDPEVVDSVFGAPRTTATPDEADEVEEVEESVSLPETAVSPVVAAGTALAATLLEETVEEEVDEEAALMAQLAALKAKKAQVKATPTPVQATPSKAVKRVVAPTAEEELSTDEFIKNFNSGKL